MLNISIEKFVFPDLRNKRVLVIGLGGGCDSLVAYAFTKDIVEPQTKCQVAIYANTIGPRNFYGLTQLKKFIYHVPHEVVPVVPGDNCYGTTKIECSLPRGPENCPLLFVVPHKNGTSVEKVFEDNKQALVEDIMQMKYDFIFGVDTGGDSLTGGIDWKDDPSLGRDRQILAILTWLDIPFLHFMFAPCSDGESSYDIMKSSIETAISKGHFRGHFSCTEMMNTLRAVSAPMGPTRTPCIMLQAQDGLLEKSGNGNVIIPRGIKPVVPKEWLLTCYVFEWPKKMSPSYMLPKLL